MEFLFHRNVMGNHKSNLLALNLMCANGEGPVESVHAGLPQP